MPPRTEGTESVDPRAVAAVATRTPLENERNEKIRALNAPVDPATEKRLIDGLRELFIDGIADVVGTSREIAAPYADQMLPRIARQIVRQQSDDPAIAASAAEHLRHLHATAITVAASEAIGLQQRMETRLITAINMVIAVGRRFILGGVA